MHAYAHDVYPHEVSYAQVLYFFTIGKKLSKRIEELQARLRRKRWKRRSACPTTRFLFQKKAYARELTYVIENEEPNSEPNKSKVKNCTCFGKEREQSKFLFLQQILRQCKITIK